MTKRLLVLKLTNTGFRARDLDSNKSVTVKIRANRDIGELNTIVFSVEKEWTFKKNTYLSGSITDSRFVLEHINVPGHEFTVEGLWDPREFFGDDAEECFFDYLAEGLREEYVFNDYTGYGFYGTDRDPVFEAVDADSLPERYDILTKLWEDYPQCIDALVHIGHLYLDYWNSLQHALNCYRTAIHIAEKNLPEDFNGVMPWICLENRPYLRALHGLCLAQWRMKDFDEAYKTAEKLLRICPGDNIGIRLIMEPIASRREWREDDWE